MWIAYIFITLSAVIVMVSGFVLPLIAVRRLNLDDVKVISVSKNVFMVNNKTIIKQQDGSWREVTQELEPHEWRAFKEHLLSQK